MAASAVSSSHAQPLLVLVFLISTCLLLPLSQAATTVNSAAVHPPFSFSFDFTNQSSYSSTDLRFEGTASVSRDGNRIDLSCNSRDKNNNHYCVGRISYHRPVPLYDDTTLASFSTSFTFVISFDYNATLADGIAFFLSGYPSSLPPDSSGGNLGLLSAAYGAGQFVAVEFDTYHNDWDPMGDHVGIDLNSVRNSSNTKSLPKGRNLSGNWTATIKFDNITTVLSASLRSNDNSSMEPIMVTQVLPDPRALLPPQVAVGFSASTGFSTELNQILAWSFNSTIAAPPPPHKAKGQQNETEMNVQEDESLIWGLEGRSSEFKIYDISQVLEATDNFSEENKLGQGGFGPVYKGQFSDGLEIAVKRLASRSGQGFKEFKNEIQLIAKLQHTNLMKQENI
ncbi:hypothetical protein U9M48_001651 [Paspalum notatum var. saurae]|uniref:Protein kinase domain-containing protein n=1 Tax=Paspalum notatum var. saurae TaxID=547442 RepID=A0AAQ3PMD1_PASNO